MNAVDWLNTKAEGDHKWTTHCNVCASNYKARPKR